MGRSAQSNRRTKISLDETPSHLAERQFTAFLGQPGEKFWQTERDTSAIAPRPQMANIALVGSYMVSSVELISLLTLDRIADRQPPAAPRLVRGVHPNSRGREKRGVLLHVPGLRKGLVAAGWIEGHNLRIEDRWSAGRSFARPCRPVSAAKS
jgi:hypothetical protein